MSEIVVPHLVSHNCSCCLASASFLRGSSPNSDGSVIEPPCYYWSFAPQRKKNNMLLSPTTPSLSFPLFLVSCSCFFFSCSPPPHWMTPWLEACNNHFKIALLIHSKSDVLSWGVKQSNLLLYTLVLDLYSTIMHMHACKIIILSFRTTGNGIGD